MAGPLHGVRIVELPAIGPVPFLGMLLADLGAEVVRVEKSPPDPLSVSALGRGRRSIALDLRRPGAAEVVLRMADRSDALIEGFRPGVAERLGVGPDAALARNRTLVYGRMTGWGQRGPLAATAGHDITYLAVSGLLHGIGPADGPPTPPVNYLADFGGGAMSLAVGLLAALLHARATGEGQVIDAAMTEGAAYLGTMTRGLFASGAWHDSRAANILDGGAPNYRCYACSDGRYVAVGALEPKFWQVLVDKLGLDAPSPYDQHDLRAVSAAGGRARQLLGSAGDAQLPAPGIQRRCAAGWLLRADGRWRPGRSGRAEDHPAGQLIAPAVRNSARASSS